jgi:radical SAM superfamily enzyme YgiQ (UPF0313 family)
VRVLIVSENRCRESLIPFPLGPACVAAAAGAARHAVRGLDLMFSEDPARDVATAIEDFSPDCVGISIRNIDNQDINASVFYPEQALAIVEAVKSATRAPLVLGGPGFSIFPLECLEYFGLELGVVGEGEESFLRLLDALQAGQDPAGLPGIAVRRGGEGKVNPIGPPPDFASLPRPERAGFGVGNYRWTPGPGQPFVANLQARRGCHLRCIYCPNPITEGRVVRMREPRAVADELEVLEKEHGIGTVFFNDALFNYPLNYTFELLDAIISRRLSLRWGCTVNPIFFAGGLYARMREAGCFHVSLGNESGSQEMLRALRKGFTREDISRGVRAARAEELLVYCFLLLGGPGENRASVEESIAFLEELKPSFVGVTAGIRVYPGCELHRIAVEEGQVEAGRNLLYPTFYVSREVEEWLHPYMREVCDSHPGWLL